MVPYMDQLLDYLKGIVVGYLDSYIWVQIICIVMEFLINDGVGIGWGYLKRFTCVQKVLILKSSAQANELL